VLAIARVYDIAFLAGRIIVGGYYLYNAFNHYTHVTMMAQHAGSKGVPLPKLAILASGTLLLLGGASILLGCRPEIGVAAIILFLIPVTLTMHNFWAEKEPMQKMNQQIHFMKNVALFGSTLMFLAIPRPWPYSPTF
jgi:putative oxidoreductase